MEIELSGGRVVKIVVRVPLTERFDVVLALVPENESAFVKTVWLNERTDNHCTLRKGVYRKP